MKPPEKKIIPPQVKGKQSGAMAQKQTRNLQQARQLYAIAKQRLLDINQWNKFSGTPSADFQLTDENGKELDGPPQAGHLIRIDLPGPGPRKGNGYDWVYIEDIHEQTSAHEDFFGIRVRPVAAPSSDESTSSHFYTPDATSSFIIKRQGTKVTAAEEGRNEVPNTQTKNILDKIRNALVAFGAYNGLAYPQWKKLMEGVLGK